MHAKEWEIVYGQSIDYSVRNDNLSMIMSQTKDSLTTFVFNALKIYIVAILNF